MKNKKTFIPIIITVIIVVAALFLIYKLPIKDTGDINLDGDIKVIEFISKVKYIDGKAYPDDDTKIYYFAEDSEEAKQIREMISEYKLHRRSKFYKNKYGDSDGEYSITVEFDSVDITLCENGSIRIDNKLYTTNRFGEGQNELQNKVYEFLKTQKEGVIIP